MTLTLLECQSHSGFRAGNFYARRAIRLYPPLLTALALAYGLLALGLIQGGLTWQGLGGQLLYFSNYQYLFWHSPHDVPNGTGILWSLAVEEHFYLLMPLLILILQKTGQLKKLGGVLLTLTLLALAWRIHLVLNGASSDRIYYATDTRFDSILFGALLAVFWNPLRILSRTGPSAFFLALLGSGLLGLLFCLAYRDIFFRDTFRYTLIGISLIPLFYCSIRFHSSPVFRWLEHGSLKKIGSWSYSIYLSHLVLIEACSNLSSYGVFNNAIAILGSILFAYIVEKFIEAPTKGFRSKFR